MCGLSMLKYCDKIRHFNRRYVSYLRALLNRSNVKFRKCAKMLKNYMLLCCLFVIPVIGQEEFEARICSTTPSDSACQQIARKQEVACNYNFHSVDCLLNIQQNTSQLGKISGDEAMLGASLLSDNVVVLGEIRSRHPPLQTVVIVKNSIPNEFMSLKNKTLCHPGYTHDDSIPRFLLKEFEYKILETANPSCNDNITLLERQISTLNSFFGDSCRPGLWTQNEKVNQKLQQTYSSLCKLCGNDGCNVKYTAPFNDSLKCLLKNDADVAVTSLHEAELFFSDSNNHQTYKYFCKNGSSSSASAPCVWSSRLPDLIISERFSAKFIENYLRTNINSHINTTVASGSTSEESAQALLSILNLNRQNITFLETPSQYQSLKQYVNERTTVPTPENSAQCDRKLNWCTYNSAEQEKCMWLRQAAVNWGIQPVVECVSSEGTDELSCIDDVKKLRADVVVASSDYAYITLKKGLTSVAFPETDTRNLSYIMAVKRADDNTIQSFNDLKDKRACIPRFGGKEHMALIDVTRNLKITDDQVCDYGKLLSDFVGDSCVPGVRSSLVKESSDYVDKDKLCQQCVQINVTKTDRYCNADEINKYFDNQGAIDCLRDKKGDFAVISRKDIANDTDLQVICKDNTLSSVKGLHVDKECMLATIPNSEVVAVLDNPKRRDIKLALFEFEHWFGVDLKKSFHLFDVFNNTLNLLFLDSTPGLNIDKELENVQEYKQLLNNVKECNINASTSFMYSFYALSITLVLIFTNLL